MSAIGFMFMIQPAKLQPILPSIPVEHIDCLTPTNAYDKLLPAQLKKMVPWCSGQTCGPVKAEIAGSNPVGTAELET